LKTRRTIHDINIMNQDLVLIILQGLKVFHFLSDVLGIFSPSAYVDGSAPMLGIQRRY